MKKIKLELFPQVEYIQVDGEKDFQKYSKKKLNSEVSLDFSDCLRSVAQIVNSQTQKWLIVIHIASRDNSKKKISKAQRRIVCAHEFVHVIQNIRECIGGGALGREMEVYLVVYFYTQLCGILKLD